MLQRTHPVSPAPTTDLICQRGISFTFQRYMLLLLLLLSSFSCVWLCATPEMAAHQAPPSLGFSRQEHWSGLPFPSAMHESEKWKWSRSSHVRLLATPWTAAYQAPPSMGFSRQEYWSGVPLLLRVIYAGRGNWWSMRSEARFAGRFLEEVYSFKGDSQKQRQFPFFPQPWRQDVTPGTAAAMLLSEKVATRRLWECQSRKMERTHEIEMVNSPNSFDFLPRHQGNHSW